ncbi:hypothetical protein B0I35DRAFT_263512 [Stachybotrys elegans]|uniref:ER membrane protein complex subunit 1 n=1 Tax=Stachybotrys elegans TaxID=80388 RepID=A0A8K0WR36_9HYPO|nr:hypothetical protein B0I35DRAFT_263512 [Stachybotrys elegans]
MRGVLQPALILGLSSLVAAVFRDEVGYTDFHHTLVGVPQVQTTFFHRPRREDKASLLYTLSDLGVIGAVNPTSGAIVWRQQVADTITNGGGFLRAPEYENWVAAAYGQRVQAWNAMNGRNLWQVDFAGEVKDLEIMELTESSRKDVLVLSQEGNVTVLRRLHGKLGTVVWEFRETGKDVPLQVSTDSVHIYLISLHGSSSSYNLKVTSLDTASGERVSDTSVGTKGDLQKPEDLIFVGANSAAPILAWKNPSQPKVHIHVLGTKGKQDIPLSPDTVSVHIHAPHLTQSQPHFLVHTRTETGNRAEVYHTDIKSGQITKAYELPQLRGLGAFSTSSDNANVYFTRIGGDEVLVVSSESPAVLARWAYKPEQGDDLVHSVSEVLKKPAGEGYAVRSATVTDSDNWVMIRNGEQDWVRPEGLSASVAAAWAEIPEEEKLAKVLEEEAETNPVSAYIHRLTRHLDDMKNLPDYLASIPTSLINSITGADTATSSEGVHPDSFGFNKIVVLATRRGRVSALYTGNKGEVIWSKDVFPQQGKTLDVKGIVTNSIDGTVTIQGAAGESATLKVLTGEVVSAQPAGAPIASTATIVESSGEWLLSFDSEGKPIEAISAAHAPKDIVVVRTADDTLKGLKFVSEGDVATATELWQLQQFASKKIVEIATRPAHDPVASIGRVLGDRRVNYKYLNPNTIVVAVLEESTKKLSVSLVDTVSGHVLQTQSYSGVDAGQPISCAITENWYTCSFFGEYTLSDGTNRVIKGSQIVVTDLYESPEANNRGPLGDTANFSSLNPVDSYVGVPLPWAVSQAWVLSQPVSKLAVTQTRQGVANRMLLAYLPESYAVTGLPRVLLDPRRPVGTNPTPADIEAEGLIKYTPSLEVDPTTELSHERQVLGVEGIIAAPAIVESTSLVVAYGVDIFGTRVAPSGVFDILGNGFDKITLILTVVALFGGVIFLSPMTRRKQINRIWEAPS